MSIELTDTQREYLNVVLELYRQKDPLRMVDVAKYMNKSTGTVCSAMKKLSEKGILTTDAKGVITLLK